MSKSDMLIRKRQEYYNLLNNITKICQNLDKGISKLDSVSHKVITGYNIDEESADHNELENIANSARNLHSQLAYTIIPAIEKKTERLSNEISDAMIEETLKRKAANNG